MESTDIPTPLEQRMSTLTAMEIANSSSAQESRRPGSFLGSFRRSSNPNDDSSSSSTNIGNEEVVPGVLSRPMGRGIERRRSSILSITTQNEWDSTYGLFDLWDADGNGTIEAAELENGVKRYIDKNIRKLSFKDLGRVVDAVRVATSYSPEVCQVVTYCMREHMIQHVLCFLITNNTCLNFSILYFLRLLTKQLDRKEFGYFFLRLCKAAGTSLEEMASACTQSVSDRSSQHLGGGESFVLHEEESTSIHGAKSSNFNMSSQIRGWDQMHNLFDLLDLDNSGCLDRNEIAACVKAFRRKVVDVKVSLAECLELLDDICPEDDDSLDRNEFAVFMSRFSLVTGVPLDELTGFLLNLAEKVSLAHEKNVQVQRHQAGADTEEYNVAFKHLPELFSTFDTDGSGALDKKELTNVMHRLILVESLTVTQSEVMDIFADVDDGNQELDIREFSCFLLKFSELSMLPLDEIVGLLMNEALEYQQEMLEKAEKTIMSQGKPNPLGIVGKFVRNSLSSHSAKSVDEDEVSRQSKEEELCGFLPFGASAEEGEEDCVGEEGGVQIEFETKTDNKNPGYSTPSWL